MADDPQDGGAPLQNQAPSNPTFRQLVAKWFRSLRTPIALGASAVWFTLAVWWTFYQPCGAWVVPKMDPNAWGDWAAGTFAPLAFLWLVVGYFQQGEELRLQAKELRASVEQQAALSEHARAQVDQLEAANRPWVNFDTKLLRLTFSKKSTAFLQLILESAGNSPAHHVQFSGRVFLEGAGVESTTERMASLVRKDAEEKMALREGTTLLPRQKFSMELGLNFPKAEVERVMAGTRDKHLMSMCVAICLHYGYSTNGHGWTEKIVRISGWHPDGRMAIPIVTEGNHDLKRLKVEELTASRGLT